VKRAVAIGLLLVLVLSAPTVRAGRRRDEEQEVTS
jgi:hypothetical protein